METPSQGLTKQCNVCGETKDLESSFYRHYVSARTGKQYWQHECKRCAIKRTNSFARKKHAINPAKAHEYVRLRAERIKREVFEHYGGLVCVCCGETEPLFLMLDHVNNDGGKFRKIMNNGGRTYEYLKRHGYPKDQHIQVLCANCNWGKRMNNGTCPHQTRCNDQRLALVEPSGSKRSVSDLPALLAG